MSFTLNDLLNRWPIVVDEEFGHWIWKGATANGIPRATLGNKTRQVRRVLLGVARRKPLPSNLYATMRCSEPRCVAPHHAEAVTKGSYMRKRAKASALVCRRMSLARRKRSHVTAEVIERVLTMRAEGFTQPQVAAATGTSVRTVWRIQTGRRTATVGGLFG